MPSTMADDGTWQVVDVGPGQSQRVTLLEGHARRHLKLIFAVDGGRSIGFEVMLVVKGEGGEEEAERLYGPARGMTEGEALLKPDSDGTVVVRWDNYTTWFTSRRVHYRVEPVLTEQVAAERTATEQPGGDELAKRMRHAVYTEVTVGAGKSEEIDVTVSAGATLFVDFEVTAGGDVDFAIMLEPSDGSGAFRLYGPAHRLPSLRASIAVSTTGIAHIGFDASSSWFRSKVMKHACFCENSENC